MGGHASEVTEDQGLPGFALWTSDSGLRTLDFGLWISDYCAANWAALCPV